MFEHLKLETSACADEDTNQEPEEEEDQEESEEDRETKI